MAADDISKCVSREPSAHELVIRRTLFNGNHMVVWDQIRWEIVLVRMDRKGGGGRAEYGQRSSRVEDVYIVSKDACDSPRQNTTRERQRP